MPTRGGRAGGWRAGRSAGYSMIELLVLVAIIGLLAAIATATYMSYRKKARSVEARLGLHMIQRLEDQHFNEYGAYSSDLDEIGFRMVGAPLYTFSVAADAVSFTGRAEANLDNDAALDVWVVYSNSEQVQLNRD